MKKILPRAILTLVVFLFLLQLGVVRAEAGPRLFLNPSSGNYSVGQTIQVKLKIDTGSKEAMAADALMSFDQNKLKVNQVSQGDFFSGFDYNIENSNGKLTIYSFSEQALVTNSGEGEIATIIFEATGQGTASVSFLCESGVDTDSAIWDPQGNDLIDCAACGSGSYEIGGDGPTSTPVPEATNTPVPGATNTPTPEATSTTAPTNTPVSGQPTATPTALPDTGIETPLLITLVGGGTLLLLSWVLAL